MIFIYILVKPTVLAKTKLAGGRLKAEGTGSSGEKYK